MLSCSIFSSH